MIRRRQNHIGTEYFVLKLWHHLEVTVSRFLKNERIP